MSYFSKLETVGADPAPMPAEWAQPLVLDLDGTLFRTDLLHESALVYLRGNPLRVFQLLVWLVQGIACLKARLAAVAQPRVDVLPVNQALADHARQAHRSGRIVVAVTASNELLAQRACAPFEFLDAVIGSTETINLKGRHKADRLASLFPQGYVYAGDAAADIPVWRQAQAAIFAGRSARVGKWVERTCAIEADFAAPRASPTVWVRALRLHQWAKNGLVFLPLLLSPRVAEAQAWFQTAVGFLALGLAASATYVINDLCDLADDRQHWHKSKRPIASGALPIASACAAAFILMTAGAGLMLAVNGAIGLALLLLYVGSSLSYSIALKRIPVLDVTMLAGLFTLRLGLGAALAQVPLTLWLGAFSMLVFWSLGLAKRATELERASARSNGTATSLSGRGYTARDLPVVTSLGTSAAVGSAIVASLYLIESAVPAQLYSRPDILWAFPPLLLMWLGRVWLLCGRGVLQDDPVTFALRDKPSLAMGALVCAVFTLARITL